MIKNFILGNDRLLRAEKEKRSIKSDHVLSMFVPLMPRMSVISIGA
jgi:hypothetical protein